MPPTLHRGDSVSRAACQFGVARAAVGVKNFRCACRLSTAGVPTSILFSMHSTDTFPNERSLVHSFVEYLRAARSPWGPLAVTVEFFYQRGRVDVIASTSEGEVVAFEAKLTRWRDALQQAYRNTCFAHRSYVLLPRAAARIAARYEVEFARRRVGLCYFEGSELIVAFSPSRKEPIQPWLAAQAARSISGAGATSAA